MSIFSLSEYAHIGVLSEQEQAKKKLQVIWRY